jgi:RNA polymerase subunit RPABC4/transcription elongation factor Spt4
MCGCLLMHAAMDHSGHQSAEQPMSPPHASVMPASGGERCSHCGFTVQQDFAFCPNCGMSFRTLECPACGRKVDRAWSGCAYCGSPLGETEKGAAQH